MRSHFDSSAPPRHDARDRPPGLTRFCILICFGVSLLPDRYAYDFFEPKIGIFFKSGRREGREPAMIPTPHSTMDQITMLHTLSDRQDR